MWHLSALSELHSQLILTSLISLLLQYCVIYVYIYDYLSM
jgi:hypothetical protein